MITIPIGEFVRLHEESAFYAVAGVAAFVASTMGSMLLKCLIARRRQRKKEEQFKNEVKEITEKTIKDGFVTIELHSKEGSVNSGKVLEV